MEPSKKTIALLAALALAPAVFAEDPRTIPIKHFIYIIQENITFDHYFGTYPGADGIPPGAKFSYMPDGDQIYTPFHLHQTFIPHDLNHSWQAAHVDYDDGNMDGFVRGEWPMALSFYWKGPLPTVDPEDIFPLDDNPELEKQDLDNANRGGRRRQRQ